MAKLLKGSHPSIIDENVKSLKKEGKSHAHATHLALKFASKKDGKVHVKTAASKIPAKKDKKLPQALMPKEVQQAPVAAPGAPTDASIGSDQNEAQVGTQI